MILKAEHIARLLEEDSKDPLKIVPQPNLEELKRSGEASIDLRLGRWFVVLRQSRVKVFDVLQDEEESITPDRLGKYVFVPFGERFILHPGNFVLGATLEWIRLPTSIAAYVTGKSSWGRRGLIIETASGIHPGFSACLTLELSNIGEVPIALSPGLKICQVFFHETMKSTFASTSQFIGARRPAIGRIAVDKLAKDLATPT